MAAPNPVRGEAAIGEHKLVGTFNQFCALEAALGKRAEDILALLRDGFSFNELRTVVRVFLNVEMTEEEAGELIWSVGVPAATVAVSAAIGGCFGPQPKEKQARPLKAG